MIDDKSDRIKFHFIDASFYFPGRTRLKKFLLFLFKREGYVVEKVNYIFCTDRYLLQLNQDYLKHDTYTDILTFALSEGKEPVIADVYISFERVKENAKIYETSSSKELHRVIFHGALHLCGYKDKKSRDKQLMRSMEELYLSLYFVSRETRG